MLYTETHEGVAIEHGLVGVVNEAIQIECIGEPGSGGAHDRFRVKRPEPGMTMPFIQDIIFQHGPVRENGDGINGLTNEALLFIVEERLVGWQSGPFACEANQAALSNVIGAIQMLQGRTKDRMSRGVEGTHEK